MKQDQIGDLTLQVQRNCDISDAQYAGALSLCSFLLLVRNFYKWEQGHPPWQEEDSQVVMGWIDERETLWESVVEASYQDLVLSGEHMDPFDLERVNDAMKPHGLLYGAGYAYGLKPTFFLGRMERRERLDGLNLCFVGRELARDMIGSPALRQGSNIYIRRQCAGFYLWDKTFERLAAKKPAIMYALRRQGIVDLDGLRRNLDALVEVHLGIMLHHEIGESRLDEFDATFKEILTAFPMSPIEKFVRSLRDVMADTHPDGTVAYIVRQKDETALALYAAFIDGFPRVLYPEIVSGFCEFSDSGDWTRIEQDRQRAYDRLRQKAKELVDFYNLIPEKGLEAVGEEIRKTLVDPLLT
ncbi:MAG: hypothetical protein HY788_17085 [Deltaproteobacteria bacterium]|nr:hypothetical protein [Deltaproteobacteria bacterium]